MRCVWARSQYVTQERHTSPHKLHFSLQQAQHDAPGHPASSPRRSEVGMRIGARSLAALVAGTALTALACPGAAHAAGAAQPAGAPRPGSYAARSIGGPLMASPVVVG